VHKIWPTPRSLGPFVLSRLWPRAVPWLRRFPLRQKSPNCSSCSAEQRGLVTHQLNLQLWPRAAFRVHEPALRAASLRLLSLPGGSAQGWRHGQDGGGLCAALWKLLGWLSGILCPFLARGQGNGKGGFCCSGQSVFGYAGMARLHRRGGGEPQALSGLLATVPGSLSVLQKSVLSVPATGMQGSNAALHRG